MSSETTVDGHAIELTHLDKVLFPDDAITKRDLIDYYRRVADTALPHYRGRALTMHRFPDGIAAEGFYQKEIPDYFPDWITRARLEKQNGTVTHVVADNAATLVYLANQACITPHLALARWSKPNHPDRLIFDLDPSDQSFDKVRKAALRLKDLLDELALRSFVQTTGSRGLHVVVPLDGSADFDATRAFARDIAGVLVAAYPRTLTVEQRKTERGDRVYIDCLRNAYGQTAVAPYAVRARAHAPVATPLDWDEVRRSDLEPRRHTITNVFRRLAQKPDPWSGIDRAGQSSRAARRRLSQA